MKFEVIFLETKKSNINKQFLMFSATQSTNGQEGVLPDHLQITGFVHFFPSQTVLIYFMVTADDIQPMLLLL